jgi:hypothetical protein
MAKTKKEPPPPMSVEDFNEAREGIWRELAVLHDVWDQYRLLYMHSNERVAVLNACARHFFAVGQRALINDVVMGVVRVLDSRRDVLSVNTLLLDPALGAMPDTADRLVKAIATAKAKAKSVALHRHKYIGHLDLDIATKKARPYKLHLREIADAIKAIEAAYNVHSVEVRGAHSFFDSTALLDADALVKALEGSDRWRRWQELQERRKVRVAESGAAGAAMKIPEFGNE